MSELIGGCSSPTTTNNNNLDEYMVSANHEFLFFQSWAEPVYRGFLACCMFRHSWNSPSVKIRGGALSTANTPRRTSAEQKGHVSNFNFSQCMVVVFQCVSWRLLPPMIWLHSVGGTSVPNDLLSILCCDKRNTDFIYFTSVLVVRCDKFRKRYQ